MSTSPPSASTNSRWWRSRRGNRGVERVDRGAACSLGRLPGRCAQHEHRRLLARELELGAHFRAVHLPLGDEHAVVPDGHHIRREAETEPRRERRCKAHTADRESRQDDGRLLRRHERLRGGDIGVGRELALVDRDGDDLVDAAHVRLICDGRGIPADDADDHRALELRRGVDTLAGDVAKLPLKVLRDDERACHQRIFSSISCLIFPATSAGSAPSISAPSPFGGTNIRRTRAAGAPRSPGSTTSISCCSACLIARSVA